MCSRARARIAHLPRRHRRFRYPAVFDNRPSAGNKPILTARICAPYAHHIEPQVTEGVGGPPKAGTANSPPPSAESRLPCAGPSKHVEAPRGRGGEEPDGSSYRLPAPSG